jgi:hypothetical protein
MTGDVPPGGVWGQITVGPVWTPQSDLNVIGAAATNRRTTAVAWQHFSDQLWQTLSGPISPDVQKGMTADTIRETFKWSANQAGDVAATNSTISSAHDSAYHWATELNSQLTPIAEHVSSRINEIQTSKTPAPMKLEQIVEVVMKGQQEANTAAAPYAQNIFEAMQTILDRRGIPKSARQFAQEHGAPDRLFGSPNKETVTEQVKGILNGPAPPQAPAPDSTPHGVGNLNQADAPPPAAPPAGQGTSIQPVGMGGQADAPPPAAPPAAVPQGTQVQPVGSLNSGIPRPPTPAVGGPAVPGTAAPSGLPATGAPSLPATGIPTTPTAPAVSAPGLSQGAPANNFLQSFEHGLQSGAPISPGLNAVPPPTLGPVEPQAPAAPAISDVPAATAPSAVHAPVFDVPPATTDTTMGTAHATASEPGGAYLAGPAASATPAAAPPPAPAGPLPTYGADIRPPTPTAVSPPTSPAGPPAAAPASAPVNPSAGSSSLGAQPVIRQPPAAPSAPPPTPAGIGEQAVVATAGGAAAGAASAQATAQARLQRFVDFVARQEPRLRWAAGERPDGTTVLVTDVASGWIPPDIDIPAAVQLLDPARRRGDIESLLGEVTVTAGYTPVHYLPPADEDTKPIPTSPRPRQGPVVDELGWELGQATKWRDGLPRLAHTLAKAASTGTGVLESEIELLREQLVSIRDQVLNAYPDDVDAAAVANWQLLASIDALAAGDKIGANYHFAWFQALNHGP